MGVENELVCGLAGMSPHAKEPKTRSVLESWISKAESEIDPSRSGRLAWLISTTIAAAKLQEVLDANGESRFALKGGTLLQHRLGLRARATRDLDGIVRGDIEDFLKAFDQSLDTCWGPISFARSEITAIQVPSKPIKPRRFELQLALRCQVWRKVVVEISPDEGRVGECFDAFPAPPIGVFGLPSPDRLVCISMSYQIAQKVHAATDPHDPPFFVNRRARDVVDLVLLKRLIEDEGGPGPETIGAAVRDVFDARAAEARALGRPERGLPAEIIVYPHWESDYAEAARGCELDLPLSEAVEVINKWIRCIIESANLAR